MDFNSLTKLLVTTGMLLLLSACASDEDDGDSESRIVISSGDTIIPLNDLQYQFPFVVQVADLNGSPLPNIKVSLSLASIGYSKGSYLYNSGAEQWVKNVDFYCPAEDINNNGILDTGEDINGNLLLDPKTPSITSHPDETPTLTPGSSSLITDNNGFGYFSLSYPKSEASWMTVRITATAEDGLPENKDIEVLQLAVLKADLEQEDDAPAFVYSPYGSITSCASTL